MQIQRLIVQVHCSSKDFILHLSHDTTFIHRFISISVLIMQTNETPLEGSAELQRLMSLVQAIKYGV